MVCEKLTVWILFKMFLQKKRLHYRGQTVVELQTHKLLFVTSKNIICFLVLL